MLIVAHRDDVPTVRDEPPIDAAEAIGGVAAALHL
jgi:hypothetical protein